MRIRTNFLIVALLAAMMIFLAACGGSSQPPAATSAPTQEPTDIPEEVAEEATEEMTESETETPVEEVILENGRILAWVAPGLAPGQHTASGDLILFDQDGTIEALMALPDGTSRVTACGPQATAPDHQSFAFMTVVTAGGRDRAALHLMHGSEDALVTVAEDLNPTSCFSSSPFEFSPDSNRLAYIDWPTEANNAASPRGRLMIYGTEDASEQADFENVTDFELITEGAVFVSFFTNDDGEATEAGVFSWDGSDDSELATLLADEDCYYPSAAVNIINEEQLALILAYRCAGTPGSQWQIHTIDRTNGTTQLELSAESGGRYFGFTDTNAVYASSDGETLWFTVPDGVSNQTVSLNYTTSTTFEAQNVLDRFAVMPSVSDLPYDANNATAVLSSDGRYLAVVVNDGNNNALLNVVDLDQPNNAPTTFDAGERGDTIAAMIFNADSTMLYFVAGTDEGGDNSLMALDLSTGNEERVSRGRFAQGALAPDSSLIAIMNWVRFSEEEDPYLSLEIVDLSSGDATVLYEGGDVVDGEATNLSFAYPLAWLP